MLAFRGKIRARIAYLRDFSAILATWSGFIVAFMFVAVSLASGEVDFIQHIFSQVFNRSSASNSHYF